jgi:putative DNA primase/helicase
MSDIRSNDQLDAEVIRLDQARDARKVSPPGQPMPNARRFLAAEYDDPDQQLLIHQGGQFYVWDGTCWPTIEDPILRSRLYRWFEKRIYLDDTRKLPVEKPFAPTVRKVADLMDALRAVTIVATGIPTPAWLTMTPEDPPADELIACENGIIHWPSRTLHRHTPRFYAHHSVPFAFDANAPRPERWLRFLNELWADDDSAIQTLQELFGYLVSGDTRQQKMFMLVGPKRGGKGTIGRVLTRMLGRHNVAGPTLATLGTNFGLQDLIAKPVAIISDARLGSKSDASVITERMLSVSGEDLQNVDRKYLPPWSGQLPTRFVVLTNELPRLADSSGALASRFIVLMLKASFYNRENPALTDELCAELPGIFNWSLEGLERLRTRGRFQQPQTSRDAVRQMEDLASPVGAFIRDRCALGPALTVEIGMVYQAYRSWCDEHGHKRVNTQVFGRDLRAVRPELSVRQLGADRARAYVGIALAHPRDHGDEDHDHDGDDHDHAPQAPQSPFTRESREYPSNSGTSSPNSRDSRVTEHCSDGADDDDHHDQDHDDRCAHCGNAGDLIEVHASDGCRRLHRGCIDEWRSRTTETIL